MAEPSICNPQDETPLTLVAVVRGEAWIVPDSAEAVFFDSGA